VPSVQLLMLFWGNEQLPGGHPQPGKGSQEGTGAGIGKIEMQP
jgi:hypothetical protein